MSSDPTVVHVTVTTKYVDGRIFAVKTADVPTFPTDLVVVRFREVPVGPEGLLVSLPQGKYSTSIEALEDPDWLIAVAEESTFTVSTNTSGFFLLALFVIVALVFVSIAFSGGSSDYSLEDAKQYQRQIKSQAQQAKMQDIKTVMQYIQENAL